MKHLFTSDMLGKNNYNSMESESFVSTNKMILN